jgi:hypothetical protein
MPCLTQADGHAEREAALALIERPIRLLAYPVKMCANTDEAPKGAF